MSASQDHYASQYKAFEDERTRPVRDLVAAIPHGPVARAVDLGCGPGNSTEVLASRYPDAQITGIDSSPDMIDAARKRLPSVQFLLGDIASWTPSEPQDVILANASLQWVADHDALYPRLIGALAPNGTLAVQTPDNLAEPAHTLIRDVAESGPWSRALALVARTPREDAVWYYRLIRRYAQRVDIWRTTYFHALAGGAPAVVEWFKGSALRPYLAQLSTDEKDEFLRRYTDAVAKAYPSLEDGTVLLPFPRLFIVAVR